MRQSQHDIESIFLRALQKSDPQQRAAYLDDSCGSNVELRREVDELLAANEQLGGFLEQTQSCLHDRTSLEKPGNFVGNYRLMEQIGEGGMGAVFVAEQRKPVRRRVALKVIKPGMDTCDVVARFEVERQALALMDHPNVARVFDAGATDAGLPFFVMELVKGPAITHYCDTHELSTDERLKLFVSVCNAIQHAHQKGIIHRDIKPSNILVASHDGVPVVKIIDFGIAKAVDQRLTDSTVFTQWAQIVGTPLYMSPEQAGANSHDIDTRSDIYSLGVLLYELMTGTLPFERERLAAVGFDEMRRIIREEEPERPSSRICSQRTTDTQQLQSRAHTDVDWIVMKTLEKDRCRRYETANALAIDIMRFLADEPIQACPPTTWYRLRKFVQRNRLLVVSTTLLSVAILLGFAGTASGLVWAMQERKNALAAANVATEKEQTSRRMLDFMLGLFREAAPEKRMGKPMTLVEFLDEGAERIQELAHEPDTMATLQETLGLLYVSLSEFEKSEQLLLAAAKYRKERAHDSQRDELAYAKVLNALAILYQWTDEQRAADLARQAAVIFEKSMDHVPELADSLNTLGNSLQRQGKLDDALTAHRRSLEIRERLYPVGHPGHGNVATALHNIGIIYFYDNDFEQAEKYYRRAIQIEEKLKAPDDPGVATAKHVLSIVYAKQWKFERARELQLESFHTRSRVFSADHDHVGLSANWLGNIYRGLGRYRESERLLRRAVDIHEKIYGSQHPLVFWDKECLLRTLVKLQDETVATKLHTELTRLCEDPTAIENRRSVNLILAELHVALENTEAARKLLLEASASIRAPTARPGVSAALAQLELAILDAKQGSPFSKKHYDRAVNHLLRQESWSEQNPQLLDVNERLASALFEAKDHKNAKQLYQSIERQWREISADKEADPFLLDKAARFYLTCRIPSLQDATLSLKLAQQANAAVRTPAPIYLRTLAQSQARNGLVASAIATQRSAIEFLDADSWWLETFQHDLNILLEQQAR